MLETDGDLWGALPAGADELRLIALVERASRACVLSPEPFEDERRASAGSVGGAMRA